jgi:hypothetical protein
LHCAISAALQALNVEVLLGLLELGLDLRLGGLATLEGLDAGALDSVMKASACGFSPTNSTSADLPSSLSCML